MKYLCLIYLDEQQLDALPNDAVEAIARECEDHTEGLRRNGELLATERLESVASATTVRNRDDRISITDGPFAETREQLAGFYLIEARDLNAAIRIAARIPPGRLGCIEVRPIRG